MGTQYRVFIQNDKVVLKSRVDGQRTIMWENSPESAIATFKRIKKRAVEYLEEKLVSEKDYLWQLNQVYNELDS